MMQAAVSEPVWQQVNRLRKAGDLPGARIRDLRDWQKILRIVI